MVQVEQVEREQNELKESEKVLISAYKRTFGSDTGKIVLADLVDRFIGPMFYQASSEIAVARMGEGNVVKYVLEMVRFRMSDLVNAND